MHVRGVNVRRVDDELLRVAAFAPESSRAAVQKIVSGKRERNEQEQRDEDQHSLHKKSLLGGIVRAGSDLRVVAQSRSPSNRRARLGRGSLEDERYECFGHV